jgi:MSHA biogenesis protein MshP
MAAIFLLAALAALIAFLTSVSGLHQMSATLDLQGARAYQAARAGIEWGAYRALQSGSCQATASFALPADLSGFAVTVTCTDTAYTESSSTTKHIYTIVSTACNHPLGGACLSTPGQQAYVERQLQVTIDKPL